MSRRLGLTRNAAPMLKTVGGKKHASVANHEPELAMLPRKPKLQSIAKPYPSPATTASATSSQIQPIEVGFDDDPLSEEDEPAGMKTWKGLINYQEPTPISIEAVKEKEAPAAKKAGAQGREETKRLSSPFDEEGEPEWIGSQPASKRRKINVIAPRSSQGSSAAGGYGKKPAAAGYGRASQRRAGRQRQDEEKKQQKATSGFRTAKGVELKAESSPAACFKVSNVNISEFMANDLEQSPTLGAARPDSDDLDSLSDLDEKAASAIEEGKLYLPPPKPYVSTHKCEHCGEEVEKLLYEEFIDDYNSGRELNIKWQRRFCNFHNKREAEAVWKGRGYPTIDWSGLERRMRKHDNFLRQILKGEQESVHRKQLQKQLAPGRRSKNIGHMMENQSVKAGTLVGYYGPRGQKAMVDHIIDNLSNDIREQAVRDDIVMAAGAQGGVSGFVQSVLVPHLAEMLIKEDFYLTFEWEAEVREVIAESGELGELMHPETEDEIKDIDDDES